MSFLRKSEITLADSPSLDAFGRFRISNPVTMFDCSFIGQDDESKYHTISTNGGTATFLQHESTYLLALPLVANASVLRETNRYFHYLPGKSHLVDMTGTFLQPPIIGVIKQMGLYDDGDGVFVRQNGDTGNYSFVLRSSTSGAPIETEILQQDWNSDRLDGTGPSKITIDFTKTHILIIDMQWLGVGRVRFGFSINGKIIYAHEILNANNKTEVYMKTATLPLRYEMYSGNVAPAAIPQMKQICSTVISEGGYEPSGRIVTHTVGGTAKIVTSGAWKPLMSFRLKDLLPNGEKNRGYAYLIDINLLNTGTVPIYLKLAGGGTLTGANFASPNSPYSFMTVDTSATAYDPTGSVDRYASYMGQDSNKVVSSSAWLSINDMYDYANPNGINNQYSIIASSMGANVNVFVSVTWREVG